MPMKELIQQWLDEDGPLAYGITLYQSTGETAYAGRFAKAAKRRWEEPEDRALLRRLLEDYIDYHPEEKPAYEPIPDYEPTTKETASPIRQEEEPEAVRALRQKAIPLHKRYSHLKAQLHTMITDRDKYKDQDRYQIAREIIEDVLPPTDEIYDQIRDWENDGTLPPDPQDDLVQQTVNKMQRVYSLRPRISRLKKWIKDGKTKANKRKEYEKELLDKELELAELEKELGL